VNARAAVLIAVTLGATVVSGADAAAPPPPQHVTGSVERVVHAQGPCRGGVAVTREELDEVAAKTQRFPLRNATFTVFAGDKHVGKPLTRFTTDRAARFATDLPAGVFCVMAGDRKEAPAEKTLGTPVPNNPHVDPVCLRERAVACDATLRVRKDSARAVKLTLDTFTPCPQPWAQPCYRGPMPP
jgi:hypothetical protein